MGTSTKNDYLQYLYRTEASQWWSVGMRKISHALLEGMELECPSILELGCGGGLFLHEVVERQSPNVAVGSDLSPDALDYATSHESLALLRTDCQAIALDSDSIDLVIGLDVFDQVSVSLERVFSEVQRVLKPSGQLIIRVCAYPWLSGPRDNAWGTGRRYRASEVKSALIRAGFTPVRFTHANCFALGPAVILRILQKWGLLSVKSETLTPRWIEQIFLHGLMSEAKLLKRMNLPMGLSIYAIARKR